MPVDLPTTLYGQLYLLAYDRHRHQFRSSNQWLYSCALRAAMLSDLYLGGYLGDRDGRAHRRRAIDPPADPLLSAMLAGVTGWDWKRMTVYQADRSDHVVRQRLEAVGYVSPPGPRRFGVLARTDSRVYDEDLIGALVDRVRDALSQISRESQADSPLAVLGLLCALGEVPTVASSGDTARYHAALRDGTVVAIPPVMGLAQAAERHYDDVRAEMKAEQRRTLWRMMRDILSAWN